MATSNLGKDVKTWEVLKVHNNSDHRYIRIIFQNVNIPDVYGLTLKGELKLLDELRNDNWFKTNQNEIETTQDIEEIVDIFYGKI